MAQEPRPPAGARPSRQCHRRARPPSRTGSGEARGLRVAIVAALLLLAGCKLVDQRTFEPTPTAPTAASLKRPDLPRLPLLTISFAIPDADWQPSVHEAVHTAEDHKPGVRFAVVTPVPTSASREVQDTFTKQGRDDATMVAEEIEASGVPPERITIGLRGDSGSPARQVQIYAQ
jgi:hypothetical protein